MIAIVAIALSACGGGSDRARPVEADRGTRAQPIPEPTREARMCMGALESAGMQYRRLPDRTFNGGCHAHGAVQLLQVGTPTRNLGAMTCPLAFRYGQWTRNVLQPAAERYFGEQVALVETMGTYSCRRIAGTGRVSEHGKANAVDIGGFRLASGKRITVLDGWNGGDRREREFLRAVHRGGCETFSIVLGPDANADHRDHLHFDMGDRGPYCR